MAKEETSLKYEIINEIGVLSTDGKWRLEINRISWNGQEPKYDIRRWAPNHEKMGKGITLSEDELLQLADFLIKEKAFLTSDGI